MSETALIVGVGDGLSASLARLFAAEGMRLTLSARNVDKLVDLKAETGASTIACDAADPDQVRDLFKRLEQQDSRPDLVVYNPSYRVRGPLVELEPAQVARVLHVTAYGGFLVGQAAAKSMLSRGDGRSGGTILFTGASASIKGYPKSAPFAMGKFALRGLAQSMARELAPQNIHVAHFVIDGGIRSARRPESAEDPDSMLDPDAIARTYLDVARQHRSAWTWEVELRPWLERF